MTPHQDSCSQLHHRQGKVFITLHLTVQDQESRQNVSRSPVGTLVFHPAEEPECRSEVSGLSLVEDPARIDDVCRPSTENGTSARLNSLTSILRSKIQMSRVLVCGSRIQMASLLSSGERFGCE